MQKTALERTVDKVALEVSKNTRAIDNLGLQVSKKAKAYRRIGDKREVYGIQE